MIVVELAGPSGAGKSTLIALVAQRLRAVLSPDDVVDLPEKGVPRRHRRWTRVKRWSWVALHPQIFWAGWKITRRKVRTTGVAEWVRSFSTMALARRAVEQGVKVALVDQGLLRMPMLPQHVPHLPRSLFPDFVIHIFADPAILEQRRLKRKKKKCLRFDGQKRVNQATIALFNLGEKLNEPERRDLLVKFAEKFCDQPFSENELESMLTKAREKDAKNFWESVDPHKLGGTVPRCSASVCQCLQKMDIPVIKVDTSEMDVETAADLCFEAVLETLEERGLVKMNAGQVAY